MPPAKAGSAGSSLNRVTPWTSPAAVRGSGAPMRASAVPATRINSSGSTPTVVRDCSSRRRRSSRLRASRASRRSVASSISSCAVASPSSSATSAMDFACASGRKMPSRSRSSEMRLAEPDRPSRAGCGSARFSAPGLPGRCPRGAGGRGNSGRRPWEPVAACGRCGRFAVRGGRSRAGRNAAGRSSGPGG